MFPKRPIDLILPEVRVRHQKLNITRQYYKSWSYYIENSIKKIFVFIQSLDQIQFIFFIIILLWIMILIYEIMKKIIYKKNKVKNEHNFNEKQYQIPSNYYSNDCLNW